MFTNLKCYTTYDESKLLVELGIDDVFNDIRSTNDTWFYHDESEIRYKSDIGAYESGYFGDALRVIHLFDAQTFLRQYYDIDLRVEKDFTHNMYRYVYELSHPMSTVTSSYYEGYELALHSGLMDILIKLKSNYWKLWRKIN